MAVTVTGPSLKVALDAMMDLCDVNPPGALKIYTTALGTLLADLPLSATAFGAATSAQPSVATAAAITDDTDADNTGTAASFKLEDGNALELLRGSVGTSGEDINLNTTSITSGDTVSITALTVTNPETPA